MGTGCMGSKTKTHEKPWPVMAQWWGRLGTESPEEGFCEQPFSPNARHIAPIPKNAQKRRHSGDLCCERDGDSCASWPRISNLCYESNGGSDETVGEANASGLLLNDACRKRQGKIDVVGGGKHECDHGRTDEDGAFKAKRRW